MKNYLNHIFIDGLAGMAHGLFATLIVGTIIQQIGLLAGGSTGDMIYLIGKMAAAVTGAGIGVGVACRFNEDNPGGPWKGSGQCGRYRPSVTGDAPAGSGSKPPARYH